MCRFWRRLLGYIADTGMAGHEDSGCCGHLQPYGEQSPALGDQFGIPKVFADALQPMDEVEFDFVDIITEAPGHEWLTRAAAERKIPVVCQKPMSDSLQSCLDMEEACRKAGVPLFINENYHWQLPFRVAAKALGDGVIGKPLRASIQLFTGGAETFVQQPFLAALKHPALQDMAPHILDLFRYLFGEIHRITTQGTRSLETIAGDDTLVMLCDAGIPVVCEIGDYCSHRLLVEGTSGVLILDNENVLKLMPKGAATSRQDTMTYRRPSFISDFNWHLHGGACVHSIIACNYDLADALMTVREPETSAANNLLTMRAVFAAMRSAEEKRTVFLEK